MDLAGAGIYSHIYTGIYMTYIFSWENVNILKFLKTSIFFKSWKKKHKEMDFLPQRYTADNQSAEDHVILQIPLKKPLC